MHDPSTSIEEKFEILLQIVREQAQRQASVEATSNGGRLTPAALAALNPHFSRNFLPNDDAIAQKNLMATWRLRPPGSLSHAELIESAFRVFSQNDEDGILLRIFTAIGTRNRLVVEIGSNCSGSDVSIPENLSSNLIVNHGWHGVIVEMDPTECDRMRYFFARDHSTRHFHWVLNDQPGYYSPVILQRTVTPLNINEVLQEGIGGAEPDLMVIDIDGGDYWAIRGVDALNARVLVVEFEKRFRERFSVAQIDGADFGRRWQQSGSASLLAWERLLRERGYFLCAIGACGFNAFFVRSDDAAGVLSPLTPAESFDRHPIFSRMGEDFWLAPDETWQHV